jgi:hypothetical protein
MSITEEDVCALFNAMLERIAEEENRLRKAMMETQELIKEYFGTETPPSATDLLSNN